MKTTKHTLVTSLALLLGCQLAPAQGLSCGGAPPEAFEGRNGKLVLRPTLDSLIIRPQQNSLLRKLLWS